MPKQTKPVLDAALASLARREHAVAELRKKLLQKGYGREEVEQTLTHLQSKNLLNDARYAEVRARSRAENSKWGATRIRQELSLSGVDKTLAATTLETLSQEHDWLAAAHKLLSRKFPKPLPDGATADPALGRAEAMKELQKEKARRISFLTRRGFSMRQALQALNLTETGEEE